MDSDYNYLIGLDALGDYLEHHGTKGQKWGLRLYQNRDGSLTPLGRARLGLGKARKSGTEAVKKTAGKLSSTSKKAGELIKSHVKSLSEKNKKHREQAAETKKTEAPDEHTKKVKKTAVSRNNVKTETPEEHAEKVKQAMASGNKEEIKKYATEVDYSTLKSAIDKADLMAKLNTVPEPKDNVKEFLNRAVDLTGSVAKLGANATTLWNLYANYSNSMHGTSYHIISAGGKKEAKKKNPTESLADFVKKREEKNKRQGKKSGKDKTEQENTIDTEDSGNETSGSEGTTTSNPDPEVLSGDVEGTGTSFTKSYSNDTSWGSYSSDSSWQQAYENINLKRIGMN